MDSFPEHIKIENINMFPSINYSRILGLFREEIYTTLLTRKDENEYIDLDTFSRKYCNNKTHINKNLVEDVEKELNDLGWKTKLSFADTGLFIYSTENPPVSCW